MNNWKTGLTACGQMLGTVNIKRGIFQGDSLSPLKFILCIVPMTKTLSMGGIVIEVWSRHSCMDKGGPTEDG